MHVSPDTASEVLRTGVALKALNDLEGNTLTFHLISSDQIEAVINITSLLARQYSEPVARELSELSELVDFLVKERPSTDTIEPNGK